MRKDSIKSRVTCCNFIIIFSYEITLVCANLLRDTGKKGNKMQKKVTRINGFIAPLLPIPLISHIAILGMPKMILRCIN